MSVDQRSVRTAPLTAEEQALEGVKQAEAEASRGTSTRSSHVSSRVGFPVTDDAKRALQDLRSSDENLVQLVSQVLRVWFF